jgi:hypothetical protein
MSTGAHRVPHRFHRPRRWMVWMVIGLVVAPVAAVGVAVAVDRAFFSGQAQYPRYPWPPEPCVVEGIDARCGTFAVPEDRAKPDGRTIELNVVVLPAFLKPTRTDAVAYLAPGGRERPQLRRRPT